MSFRNGAVKTCEMTERFLLPSQPCPLEQVLKSLSSGKTYRIQKKKKDWFLLSSPGTTSVCGEFPLQHPVSTSSLKNTKEGGAGKKAALPPKSPTPRLVGSVRNLRCCLTIDGFWMPVWFASDFGPKQGEGGPINFFAPLWQLLHIL